MPDTRCPQCQSHCLTIGTCKRRGAIYRCDTCQIPANIFELPYKVESEPPHRADSLLWFYESDRMWEDFSEAEGMNKPELVKVILVVEASQLDLI